jgi:O-antigen ligase
MSIAGLAFTLFFFGLLGAALIKHPRFGMYAYIAAFYVHPPSRWWGASLPDFRWSLLAAAITLIAIYRCPAREGQIAWHKTTPARLLIAFTLWVWLQNLWAMDSVQHWDLTILYTKYLILFFLVYRLTTTPEEMQRFLMAHVAGCFYLGYLAFGSTYEGRLEGVGGPGIDEANALAMQLATGVMCSAMFVLAAKGTLRIGAVLASAFILNGIVLCGSRGAFLAVLCGGVILMFMKPQAHKKLFYTLAVLGVLMFGMVANQAFWERIGTIGAAVDEEQEMDTSAESRFVIIEAQTRMALRYPFGTGHRGTEVLSRDYIDEKYLSRMPDGTIGARSSHNTFMSAWAEQGFIGAAIFIFMVLWCRKAAKQLRRYAPAHPPDQVANFAGIAAVLVVVFIAGLFVDYIKTEVMIWFFALLAAAVEQCRLAALAAPTSKDAPSGVTRDISVAPRSARET